MLERVYCTLYDLFVKGKKSNEALKEGENEADADTQPENAAKRLKVLRLYLYSLFYHCLVVKIMAM